MEDWRNKKSKSLVGRKVFYTLAITTALFLGYVIFNYPDAPKKLEGPVRYIDIDTQECVAVDTPEYGLFPAVRCDIEGVDVYVQPGTTFEYLWEMRKEVK